MSQFQGPPPTLTELVILDKAITVRWDSDSYVLAAQFASLIYVNLSTNEMKSILLNEEQLSLDQYTIINLTNGVSYSIFLSIYDSGTSGITYNSLTLVGIPAGIPLSPVIEQPVLVPTSVPPFSTVLIAVALRSSNGSDITHIVFRMIDETAGTGIESLQYPVNQSGVYAVPVVSGNTYIISVQARNSAGYSEVSNSVSFINGYSPNPIVLDQILSGTSTEVEMSVSGTNQTNPLMKATFILVQSSAEPSGSPWTDFATVPVSLPPLFARKVIKFAMPDVNLPFAAFFRVIPQTAAGAQGLPSNSDKSAVFAVRLVSSGMSLAIANVDATHKKLVASWTNSTASYQGSGFSTASFFKLSSAGVKTLIGSEDESTLSGAHTSEVSLPSLPVAGDKFLCELTGHTEVSSADLEYWMIPALVEGQFEAKPVEATATYSEAPGQVQSITYTTDLVPDVAMSGEIQFNWLPPANDGGSAIIMYHVQLYTNSAGVRTPLGAVYNTNALNAKFSSLDVALRYSVGIIAENSVGNGPVLYNPVFPFAGITITGNVDPVTNLAVKQTFYDATKVEATISWEYAGPGANYENASFKVCSVNPDGSETTIATLPYSSFTELYSHNVILPPGMDVSYTFGVEVVATVVGSGVSSTSIESYVTLVTGSAPIISGVGIVAGVLSFTVRNPSSGNMLPKSIISQVIGADAENPFVYNYDVALVDAAVDKTYTFTRTLGYVEAGPIFITAGNLFALAHYEFGFVV